MLEEVLKAKSKVQIVELADFYCRNSTKITDLFDFFNQSPNPILKFHVFWILRKIFEKNSTLITPFYTEICFIVSQKQLHDGVYRSILAILAETDYKFTEEDSSILCNVCFDFISDKSAAIAIKIHAMGILEKIILEFPELKQELIFVLEDQFPFSSVGFKSRALKLIQKLQYY